HAQHHVGRALLDDVERIVDLPVRRTALEGALDHQGCRDFRRVHAALHTTVLSAPAVAAILVRCVSWAGARWSPARGSPAWRPPTPSSTSRSTATARPPTRP